MMVGSRMVRMGLPGWLIVACSALASLSAAGAQREATLRWVGRVELSTPVSGVVAEVPAEVGRTVAKGAVLMRLDDRLFKAELARARAELVRLGQLRDEAKRELDRAKDLYDRTLLANHDLEMAKIGYSGAVAQHEAAKAAVTRAQLDLEYAVLRAPFDAVVLARNAEPGQTVVSRLEAVPLIVVAEAGRMIARVMLTGDELSGLREGLPARVKVGDRSYDGTVQSIAMEPEASPGGVPLYAVDALFSHDPATVLRAGLAAEVSWQ